MSVDPQPIPRRRVAKSFDPAKRRTDGSGKAAADVNAMMARYQRHGVVPQRDARQAFYGDFSNVDSYMSAMDALERARAGFQSLPAVVRDRFSNNPALLLGFLLDSENQDEARQLGLVEAEPAPDPVLEELQGLRQDLAVAKPEAEK